MASFEKEFFASNRRRLFEILPDRSAMLLSAASLKTRSGDSHYPFCPDKNFYYMTGYENPSAAVLFKKNGNNLSTTMFVIQLTPLQIHWNGYLPNPDEVKDITGIESVLTIDSLNRHIGVTLSNIDTLFIDFHPVSPYDPLTDVLQTVAEIRRTNPQVTISRAHHLLARLREIKAPVETEKIQKAIDLTLTAIDGLLPQIKPGSTEYQLEACFNYELHSRRCQPAFQTIIAAGNNATILHYSSLGDTLQKGELVLLDLGAEYCHYSADISRTFPVDGVFSNEHRRLYELVLEANARTIESVKPGVSFAGLNETARDILAAGMKKLGYITDEKEIGRFLHSRSRSFTGS